MRSDKGKLLLVLLHVLSACRVWDVRDTEEDSDSPKAASGKTVVDEASPRRHD